MLALNAEQVQRLQAIQLARDTRQLGDVLAGLFPDIPARLGERYPALIAHAVQRAAAHGLTHAVCVARLLACWFMLGAEFENKPGFDWARQLLADMRRTQGAKVFQLCRRTREMLARWGTSGAAGAQPMPPPAFDQAIGALDAALMDFGNVGALQRGGRVALGQACDIDAIDLRLAGAQTHLVYAVQQGQWARVPAAAQPAPVTLRAGQPAGGDAAGAAGAVSAVSAAPAGDPAAPALPQRLTLLGRPAGAAPARLRVRTLAAQCCDPLVHPLVVLNGAQGINAWRGRLAADITLDLYSAVPAAEPSAAASASASAATSAAPSAPANGALQPAIAVESPAQLSQLQLSSCGLREDGAALGDLQTQIAVYPAEQHLVAWRREALGELTWPEPPGGHAPHPAPRCRIERDGIALDATRWQAGLADLDRQLLAALPRLLTAWERTSGVSQGRLTAEPRVLCGDAGISWGWVYSANAKNEGTQPPPGLPDLPDLPGLPDLPALPYLRIAGRMELIACQLSLRFGGQLAVQGAVSHLSLQSHAREMLQLHWERAPGDADLLPASTPVQTTFRQPFVLHLDTLAQADVALLDNGPVTGAVVGSCGLRPRVDGQGLQWFAQIAVEPVSATLHLHDPLLGRQELLRPLLPAMKLLDWSLP